MPTFALIELREHAKRRWREERGERRVSCGGRGARIAPDPTPGYPSAAFFDAYDIPSHRYPVDGELLSRVTTMLGSRYQVYVHEACIEGVPTKPYRYLVLVTVKLGGKCRVYLSGW